MDEISVIRNARIGNTRELVNVVILGRYIDTITADFNLEKYRPKQIIDVQGKMLLPSFINCHTHLDKAGLAGKVRNLSGTINEARKKVLEAKKGISKNEISERAEKIIQDSLQWGVTIIRTHVDIDPILGLKGVEALLELKDRYKDFLDLQIVAFPQEGISEVPGTYALMQEAMEMGCDLVGGHLSVVKDYLEHTRKIYDLAEKYDKDIDVHADYDIDRDYERVSTHGDGLAYPDELSSVVLCEEGLRREFRNKISISHLCGLDSVVPDIAKNVIELLKKSKATVIALPPNNIYMHGRSDGYRIRRGVTPVKKLLKGGVEVIFGPDNLRDPFNPLGNPNMVHNAVLTSYASHMSSEEDMQKVMDMCTVDAAKTLRLEKYGLKEGCLADFVVLDCTGIEELLAREATVTHVFKRGRLIANNTLKQERLWAL